MSEVYFYLVSVCIGATWKENIFVYSSKHKLTSGEIVKVPFGKITTVGFVVKQTTKPTVNTKDIDRLPNNPVLPDTSIRLIEWLNNFYPNAPGLHTQYVLPSFISDLKEQDFKIGHAKSNYSVSLPNTTKLQNEAIKNIYNSAKTTMLHGITGSGKTRVYQELVKKTLKDGKNVMIIYPEISLTSHIYEAFRAISGENNLHLYHSKSTLKRRRNTWISALQISSGQIFIGPRSSLFLPVRNLGLIIIDEAHDSSLKQDSGSRYNGLMVAGNIANNHNAKLVLGSATPPIQETNFILNSGGNLVCMHDLAISNSSRIFEVIDMTNKSNVSSKNYLLSKKLQSAISESLNSGRQSLLFLNRRGTARSLICENCGWHSVCNYCENPHTYHHDKHSLICHLCGKSKDSPISCPGCSEELKLKSPGTKAIEIEIKKLFPSAKVMRFDSDNSKNDSMSENYKKIRDGNIDIIIGTQIITKGLDLPNLETVGVLQADSSLYLPDYSSQERTFQLLTQVSGRTGRGHGDGKVFLQTYNPDNSLFKFITSQDWHKFYNYELESRMSNKFPPFSFMARIWVNKNTEKAAIKASGNIAEKLNDKVKLLGPAPSFYEKKSGKYSWQVVLFSNSRQKLSEIMKSLPKDYYYDLDPVSLL